MTEATIRRQRTSGPKGAERETESTEIVEVDVLLGDGAASVERSRSIRKGLPYGEFAVSASCTIRLTCNQDRKTIMKAAKAATRLIDKIIVNEDVPFMERLLDKAGG